MRFLRQLDMEQGFQFLASGLGQRHQTLTRILATRLRSADVNGHRATADRRSQPQELAALEIADALRLPAVHSQQIGGALHVDIEEGAAHQEIGRLGGNVLRQLGEPLGGDHAGQPALPAATHQIGSPRA